MTELTLIWPVYRGVRHRCELEAEHEYRGLSKFRELAWRLIAFGVVDRRQLGSVGNWVLGVIDLMTQHKTFFVFFLKQVEVTEAIVLKTATTAAGLR